MIDFVVEKDFILLEYQSERDTNYWVIKKLEDVGQVTLKRIFYFSKSDLYLSNGDFGEIDSDEPLKFVFAHQAGEYYKIDGRILSTITAGLKMDRNGRFESGHTATSTHLSIVHPVKGRYGVLGRPHKKSLRP